MDFFPVILQASEGGGLGGMILMWGAIILIFWFFMIRPQMKRHKEHQAMVQSVSRGDTVTTGGGLIGKVIRVQDDIVEVEIANGVKVQVVKQTLSAVDSKTKPAKADKKK